MVCYSAAVKKYMFETAFGAKCISSTSGGTFIIDLCDFCHAASSTHWRASRSNRALAHETLAALLSSYRGMNLASLPGLTLLFTHPVGSVQASALQRT